MARTVVNHQHDRIVSLLQHLCWKMLEMWKLQIRKPSPATSKKTNKQNNNNKKEQQKTKKPNQKNNQKTKTTDCTLNFHLWLCPCLLLEPPPVSPSTVQTSPAVLSSEHCSSLQLPQRVASLPFCVKNQCLFHHINTVKYTYVCTRHLELQQCSVSKDYHQYRYLFAVTSYFHWYSIFTPTDWLACVGAEILSLLGCSHWTVSSVCITYKNKLKANQNAFRQQSF